MGTIQVLPFWGVQGTLSSEMTRGYLLNGSFDRRWRLLAVLLVIIGHLGIVSAALTLARDESSVISHTERSGTNLHHGHSDVTCTSCVLLSMQLAVADSPPLLEILAASHLSSARLAIGRLIAPVILPNSCRAPPSQEV